MKELESELARYRVGIPTTAPLGWINPTTTTPARRALQIGTGMVCNLRDDPSEQNDLAEKEPVRLRQMMEGLIARTEAFRARYPHAKDGKTRLKPELP